MSDSITWEGYLTLKANLKPYCPSISGRLTKNKPSCGPSEIAVKLSVKLPKSLFQRPTLQATLEVDPETVDVPVIDLAMQDTVAEVLRDRTGFDVRIEQIDMED